MCNVWKGTIMIKNAQEAAELFKSFPDREVDRILANIEEAAKNGVNYYLESWTDNKFFLAKEHIHTVKEKLKKLGFKERDGSWWQIHLEF